MNETSDGTSNVPATFDSGVSFNQKKKYYVYLLYSYKDKGLYIGFTVDLKERLLRHASGKVSATMFRRPLKLIYYEYFTNIQDAKAREEFLKSGYGRKQLSNILKRTFSNLKSSLIFP